MARKLRAFSLYPNENQMAESTFGYITYAAREGQSPRNPNRTYFDMGVRIGDGELAGREAKMFANDDDDRVHMSQFQVGDKVELDSVTTKGEYVNVVVGELIESAADIQERIGDLDAILAAEYMKSLAAVAAVIPGHYPPEFLQSAVASVFIQKSKMVDFIQRAEQG